MSDQIYLSRIKFPLRSRESQRLVGDCHAMHQFVMRGFPQASTETARVELGVLYRLEPATGDTLSVLVQSAVEPTWEIKAPGIQVDGPKNVAGQLDSAVAGRTYRFRIRANPTRRVHERATRDTDSREGHIRDFVEEARSAGKRVAIRDDEGRMAWLNRKVQAAGCRLITGEVQGGSGTDGTIAPFFQTRLHAGQLQRGRRNAREVTFETCLFEGKLEVLNAEAFRNAVLGGVGPGKAFGCGLLSFAAIGP